MYCKNCRFNSSVRLTELLVEVEHLHWDVVLFSEARTDTKQIDFEEGHRLYTYIGDHFAAGVGILVHQRHVSNIVRHLPVSDRLLEVDIRIGNRIFAFIAVYMPHAGYHVDILNSTYDL